MFTRHDPQETQMVTQMGITGNVGNITLVNYYRKSAILDLGTDPTLKTRILALS